VHYDGLEEKQCPGSGLFEQHPITLLLCSTFKVLNLEVDCKEAEQKLLELFFK